MATGKVHTTSTLTLAVSSIPVTYLATKDIATTILFCGGIALGAIISPDLDLPRTEPYNLVRRLLGRWACDLFTIWWYPYEKLVPHRSVLHFPPVGTVVRFLWAFWPLGVLLVSLGLPIGSEFVVLLLGLVVADTLHTTLDL